MPLWLTHTFVDFSQHFVLLLAIFLPLLTLVRGAFFTTFICLHNIAYHCFFIIVVLDNLETLYFFILCLSLLL